jgi:hypothetical protein
LSFARNDPKDKARHHEHHRNVVDVFDPRPNHALRKRYEEDGTFVPVSSSGSSSGRLYQIARMLMRENGYDVPPWDEKENDGHGYLIVDYEGRALGGTAVCWQEWTNSPACWVLDWIWIAPPYRRQGMMRKTWEMCREKYPGIIPRPPFSAAAKAFFRTVVHRRDRRRAALPRAPPRARSCAGVQSGAGQICWILPGGNPGRAGPWTA